MLREEKKTIQAKTEHSKRIVLDPNMNFAELEKLYTTSDANVRLQVIRVLSKRNTTPSLNLLYKGCNDQDARVRRLSTDALGNFPCKKTIDTLKYQLKDIDDVVRLKAVESLGKVGDKNIVSFLKDLLFDPNTSVQRNAVELFCNLADESMAITCTELLKSKDYTIRLAGLRALQKIGGPVLSASLSIACRDVDERIREKALQIIGDEGNESMTPILLNIINSADTILVRRAAAEAFSKVGDASGMKQVLRVLKNEKEDTNIRASIAKAIGRIGGLKEIPLLLSLLKSSDSLLRMNAIIGLGTIQDSAPLATLKYLLEHDSDALVRGAAAWAIGEIGEKQSLPYLYKALKDKNSNVCIAAAEAIASMNYLDAIDALEQALDDSDEFVRAKIMKCLNTLRV